MTREGNTFISPELSHLWYGRHCYFLSVVSLHCGRRLLFEYTSPVKTAFVAELCVIVSSEISWSFYSSTTHIHSYLKKVYNRNFIYNLVCLDIHILT